MQTINRYIWILLFHSTLIILFYLSLWFARCYLGYLLGVSIVDVQPLCISASNRILFIASYHNVFIASNTVFIASNIVFIASNIIFIASNFLFIAYQEVLDLRLQIVFQYYKLCSAINVLDCLPCWLMINATEFCLLFYSITLLFSHLQTTF